MFRGKLHCQALQALTATVEQTLPKAKKEAFLQELRQAGVAKARELKKEAALSASSSPACSIYSIPDHLLFKVFEKLEPLDLARAACVSLSWTRIAVDDALWSRFLTPESRLLSDSKRHVFQGIILCCVICDPWAPVYNLP